ncbi:MULTISPECIES: helix-turn-helix transcriptional regulator [Pseudomonas]|uniref:helix-turn-helix domain-containing protein n=1 Tax=Pseudomonas TaxID=286 RepID=UPI001AE2DCD6|nr:MULTISPECIES: helix-turn-helix transcriptional regulator [unclassified Pseudomonas]MBP1125625.1 transcriptional regulator with XRE-family HTH domain [Pseudomonas sp. PvP025]MDQ0399485.1 transcriptional regulator with XRE-family HTH domain [Pseudomonas sp. PvP006]
MQPTTPVQRASCFSTLLALILKDIRLERNVHQAYIAQAIGKTPSAWGKIESAQSPLQMDSFFGACYALAMHPSQVMQLAERLVPVFNRYNWYFQSAHLGEEDELVPLLQQYYASSGYEALKSRPLHRTSILTFGSYFNSAEPTVVHYCSIPQAKDWIDSGALPSQPTMPGQPPLPLNLVTTAVAGKNS